MRDTSNNKFLSYLYDMYEAYRFPQEQAIKTVYVKPPRKKGIKGFFRWLFSKKQKVDVNITYEDRKDSADKFAKSLKDTVPDFDTLWDFCEFIRVSEKVFFYHNSPDMAVYSEMKFDNSTTRKLRVKHPDIHDYNCEIRLTLEHNILGSDVISINVVRDYGLKMETTYKVVDSSINYEDASDILLINEINRILQTEMYNVFCEVEGYIMRGYYE